jgi:predicted DNA-binding transcriptional regulator AlpA
MQAEKTLENPKHDRKRLERIVALPPNPVLSAAVTAEFIGCSPKTLERLADSGKGPPRVVLSKRRIGYRLLDVEAWLASRTFTSRAAEYAAEQAA